MKRILFSIALLLVCLPTFAQQPPPSTYDPQIVSFRGVPSGPCQIYQLGFNELTATYYACQISNHTWTAIGGSSSTAFSAITSGTNTIAAMLLGNGSSLGATGTGTNTANKLTPAGTSGNCMKWGSSGAPADFGFPCTQSLTGPRAINPLDYGVKADGQVCFGQATTVVLTISSTTVRCDSANFTSADIGKTIFATNGCCLYLQSRISDKILAPTTIASITSTHIVVVNGPGATASCSGVTCEVIWGTNDDTGWTAADAAWSAAGTECRVMSMPAGFSLIKLKHFNTTPGGCLTGSIQAVLDLSQSFVGTGMGSSAFIIQPDLDLSTCTTTYSGGVAGCYFTQQQLYLQGFSFLGGGSQLTAPASETALVAIFAGSSIKEVGFSGLAANTTNVDGIFFHSGVRADNMYCDGFGKICWKTDDVQGLGAENFCSYCFAGDSATYNAYFSNRMVDVGSEYGPAGASGGVGVVVVGTYYAYGVKNFQAGIGFGTNSSALEVAAGSAYLNDTVWDMSSCGGDCNGLFLTGSGKVYAKNSTLTGAGAGAGINGSSCSGCKYYDQGGNTVNSVANFTGVGRPSGLPSQSGTPVVASGFGTSAAVASGSSTVAFTIGVGTSNTGTGVVTMPTALPTGSGWACTAVDVTTTSSTVFFTRVVPTSATSVTFQNYDAAGATHAWVDSDVLSVKCEAY